MKFAKGKYTKQQRDWCRMYENKTGFDPHAMLDFESGKKTFVQAAKDSIKWFEDWASDTYLIITKPEIPGDDLLYGLDTNGQLSAKVE